MIDLEKARRFVGPGFTDDASRSRAAQSGYYTGEAVYRAEIEQVFHHEWNYVCHQSQIPQSGDYLSAEIGEEAIFVIRGHDGDIRAFYNVCQHRGHELVRGAGNAGRSIVCPYHAWTYGLDGALRGAPQMQAVEGFDRTKVRLAAPRVEIIGGFVFLNFDPDAPSLRDMAPSFEPAMDAMAAEMGSLRFVKQKTFDIRANWKVVVENFLEAYHVEYSGEAHKALGRIIDMDTYRFEINDRTIEYLAGGGAADATPYDVNIHDDFTNAHGARFHQVFLYPHMTFSVFPGTNMLFVFNMRPTGPETTCEDILYFTLDGEMSDPTETAEAYVSDQLNPEDVALVEGVQRGLRSRGYTPGRLMVDADQQAGWSEHFVHHFNMLNLRALTR